MFLSFFLGGGRGRGGGGERGGAEMGGVGCTYSMLSLCLKAIDPRMPTMPGRRVFTDQARG